MNLIKELNNDLYKFLKYHPIYDNNVSNLKFNFEINIKKPIIVDNDKFKLEILNEIKKHLSSAISDIIFNSNEITNITNVDVFFKKTNEFFFILNPNNMYILKNIQNFKLYPNINYSNYSIYKIGKINDIYIFEDNSTPINYICSVNPSLNIVIENIKENNDRLLIIIGFYYEKLNRIIYKF